MLRTISSDHVQRTLEPVGVQNGSIRREGDGQPEQTRGDRLAVGAPDLELALWFALGALAGGLDRELIVGLVPQRHFASVLVFEFECEAVDIFAKLGRDFVHELSNGVSGVSAIPRTSSS